MRTTTSTLMILALIFTGAAAAGERPGDRRAAGAEDRADNQSRLSLGSVRAMGSATAFSRLDADGNRAITRTEANAMQGLPQQFGRLDADGNGELSAREFAALSVGNSNEHVPAAGRPGIRTGAEAEVADDMDVEDINRTNAVQAFNNVDTDGDFKLDQHEAARIRGLEQRFAELDRDGDGALDYAEFNAITSIEHRDR